MNRTILSCAIACLAAVTLPAASSFADSVSGNPATDGWNAGGNSLSLGTYVRNGANYDYNTYGTAITVTAGSNLNISAGADSWLVGDSVLGVGGVFTTATPTGWTVSGTPINADLNNGSGPKLQAKFGADNNTFSTSTTAPGSGNGLGSFDNNSGLGGIQIRTPTGLTNTDWATGTPTWPTGSGNLFIPTKASDPSDAYVIVNDGHESAVDPDVARIIWNANLTTGVTSWEILLNVSLLGRIGDGEPVPSAGHSVLMTVQNNDGDTTDALVTAASQPLAVPLPASAWMGLTLLGALALTRKFPGKTV
jgi:hypothetical protein